MAGTIIKSKSKINFKWLSYLLGAAVFAILFSSCATYNQSNLEIRKRSRLEMEAPVVDMRGLKTPYDIAADKKRRALVKDGKSKLDLIQRTPPSEALVPVH